MKNQWALLLGLLFALIIAVFAVVNVEAVTVDYVFGTAEWPLILVILGSALMGALIIGSVGMVRVFRLQREVKTLQKEKINANKPVSSHDSPAPPEEKPENDAVESNSNHQQ